MNTLHDTDCCLILAMIARSSADTVNAAAQAVAFFKACREQDPEYWRYAASPDLVEALGGMSADEFLEWR